MERSARKKLVDTILAHNRFRWCLGSNNRFTYYRDDALELFGIIEDLGIFDYYTTNKGEVIGESQIVAFLLCGGYEDFHLRRNAIDGDQVHVHHIDGNTQNNKPQNLIYLGAGAHRLVSELTFTTNDFQREQALSSTPNAFDTPFNRNGDPIKNHHRFLASVVLKTQAFTSLHRSQKCCTIGITKLIKKLPSIALQQAAGAYKESPFSWFNKELLLALRPDLGRLIGCPPLNGSAA